MPVRKPIKQHEIPKEIIANIDNQKLIEYKNGKKAACVKCECPHCGEKRWIRIAYIRSGHTKTSRCRSCYLNRGANFKPMIPSEQPEPKEDYILHFDHQKLRREESNGKQMMIILTECPDCGIKKWNRINAIRNKKLKSTRCTSCAQKNRVHPLPSNGITITNGYREINIRTLDKETRKLVKKYMLKGSNRNYVYEHRLVALKKFGPKIFENKVVVRHINGDKLDNSPDNIMIGSQNDNIKDHMTANNNMKVWRSFAVFLLNNFVLKKST